jgi:hypothetical protein
MPVDWKYPAAVVAAGLWCLSGAPTALAGRVVAFEILLDGKVVLQGHKLEGDAVFPPNEVWKYLHRMEFHPPFDTPGATVPADADDPLRATLTGKVRIFSRYGGDVEVATLTLVRDKKDDATWRVAPKEVERTFQIRKVDPQARPRGP